MQMLASAAAASASASSAGGKENAMPPPANLPPANLPPMQSVQQHKQMQAAARAQQQQQQLQAQQLAQQEAQLPSSAAPAAHPSARPAAAMQTPMATHSDGRRSVSGRSVDASVSAAAAASSSPLRAEMDSLASALHAKLADLDSKFLKHTHKAIAGAVECMAAAQQRDADHQVQQMRDACDRQLAQERAAHRAAEQQWAERMQSMESACAARVVAADATAAAVQRRLDESQTALLDAQTKYAALQGKWKELKRILQAKQAPPSGAANAAALSSLSSPPAAAAAAAASPAPVPAAAAVTASTSTASVPAVDPRAISALLASQQEEQQQAMYQQQQAQLQSAARSPAPAAPVPASTPASRRSPPPPPPLPLPQATEDPFATPPSPSASLHAPLLDAMPPLEQSTQQQQQAMESRARPLLGNGLAHQRSPSPSLQAPIPPVAASPSPPQPPPPAAVASAAASPAASGGHSWKSKKIYSAVDLNHNSRAPAAGQVEARATSPFVDAAPIAARAASPSPPPAASAAPAPGAPGPTVPSPPAGSVSAPPAPAAIVAAPVPTSRAPVAAFASEEDDCVVIDAAEGPTTPSYRVRAAARPSTTRSPAAAQSSTTTSPSRADGFAVPAPMAPKAWQPAAAARKSLAAPISASATSATAAQSAQVDARLQKKRQRAAAPTALADDDELVASSRPHRPLPGIITAPSRASPSKKPRSAPPAHPQANTVPAAASAAASPLIAASSAASPSGRPSVSLSELLAGGGIGRQHPSPTAAAPNASAFLSPPPTAARPSPPQAQAQQSRSRAPSASPPPAGGASTSAAVAAPIVAPYISTERSREVRDALPGYSCRECDAFYAAVGMDRRGEDGRTCDHVASRHRYQFPPALTPESYWDVCSPTSTKAYEGEATNNGRGKAATNKAHAIHSITTAATAPSHPARAAVMEYEPTSQELELERQMNVSLDR